MSRGAEVRAMQGFRGDPMPSTVSVIARSWRVSTLSRSDGVEGDRCINSFDVGFGSMWSQCWR